ncbi:hypothetical protein CCR75_005407 [Bremia lactucae]|uniref:Uncharacterized protein n=1 Tax=Bremia lactucae TaxID=4779 RepID=A0A976IDT5_BRELC|nr:hypothetical protein CCR75_005407 [Bremia lactucae]
MQRHLVTAIFLVGVTACFVTTLHAINLTNRDDYRRKLNAEPLLRSNTVSSKARGLNVARKEMWNAERSNTEGQRWWLDIYHKLIYELAWLIGKPGIAFEHLHADETWKEKEPNTDKKFLKWLLRVAKFRAKGGQFDDNDFIRLLKYTTSAYQQAKLFVWLQHAQDFPSMNEFAKKQLWRMKGDPNTRFTVYQVLVDNGETPASIFKNDYNNEIGATFVNWLFYVKMFRDTQDYSEEDLFRLLTKHHSNEAVIKEFTSLAMSTSHKVPYYLVNKMLAYLISKPETTQLVFDTWLASRIHPAAARKILLPGDQFDPYSVLFGCWLNYVRQFREISNTFSNDDFSLLLSKTKSDTDLVKALSSFRNDPRLQKLVETGLVYMKFLMDFKRSLKDRVGPEEVFASMQPSVSVDAENFLFRHWLRYAWSYMKQNRGDATGKAFTNAALFDFLMKEGTKSIEELANVFRSLLFVSRLEGISQRMLLYMASTSKVSTKVLRCLVESGQNPFSFILPLGYCEAVTFTKWFKYLTEYTIAQGRIDLKGILAIYNRLNSRMPGIHGPMLLESPFKQDSLKAAQLIAKLRPILEVTELKELARKLIVIAELQLKGLSVDISVLKKFME